MMKSILETLRSQGMRILCQDESAKWPGIQYSVVVEDPATKKLFSVVRYNSEGKSHATGISDFHTQVRVWTHVPTSIDGCYRVDGNGSGHTETEDRLYLIGGRTNLKLTG